MSEPSTDAGARWLLAHCSFCARPNTDVGTLVAGPGVFICDDCVNLCARIIAGTTPGTSQLAPWEQEMSRDDVLAALPAIAAASLQVDRNLAAWVHKARTLGASWAQIGDALGITRQSAWERFTDD